MAWVAVDTYGIENIYESEPYRANGYWWDDHDGFDTEVSLPKGTIKKLIGKHLQEVGKSFVINILLEKEKHILILMEVYVHIKMGKIGV